MIRIAILGISLMFMVNTAASATLDTIRQSGVIKIGYRTDASPLSYANPAGLPSGYTVDLCKMVVRGLKSRLQMQKLKIMYVPVTAKNRFDMIQQSKVDLLALGGSHGHVDAALAIGALAAFTPVGVGSPDEFVAMGAVEFDTHG